MALVAVVTGFSLVVPGTVDGAPAEEPVRLRLAQLANDGQPEQPPIRPLRIWSDGDSTSYFMTLAFFELMRDRGAEPVRAADYKISSGLANRGSSAVLGVPFSDWPSYGAEEMARYTPDIVVFMVGANDLGYAAANPADYAKRVAAMMDVLRAHGRVVLWMGQPNLARADLAPLVPGLNAILSRTGGGTSGRGLCRHLRRDAGRERRGALQRRGRASSCGPRRRGFGRELTMQHHQSFRAMDTQVDLFVEHDGPPPLDALVSIRLFFEEQEQRFSRFRPTSLLSALNRGKTIDDPWFAAGCGLALEAHAFTGGLFNPMVLPALVAAGYDRTFVEVAGGEPRPLPAPDPRECLVIDGQRVTLRHGQLDLGGIVKGWTVDCAVEHLRARYPDLMLNAGGDLRAEGSEAGREGWLLAIEGLDGADGWTGTMTGAMATSTTLKRRWRTASGGAAHHLIDPRTGLPAESPYVQVTAFATECWRAEVWAKAVLIGGEAAKDVAQAAGIRVLALASSISASAT